MKESMIGEMMRNCPNNRQAQNELNIWIDSYSGDLFNLICGDYTEDSDKCEKLGPLVEAPSSRSGRKSRPKYLRSISLTVAEIFDTFPELSTRT